MSEGLSLPDIEPYRSPTRRADPTDGVVARWLRARGHPVPKKWTKASRKKAYAQLGIPPLRQQATSKDLKVER